MHSFQTALADILAAIPIPDSDVISTRDAFGRTLAETLTVPRNFPDTALAAVDGYAFCLHDQPGYRRQGTVAAGQIPDFRLEPGTCAAVMTGAPVPDGADGMARIEDCREEAGMVVPDHPVHPGDLINLPAGEAKAGQSLAAAGRIVRGGLYPALFYAGIPQVRVFRRPRIGMLSTGDELCDIDEVVTRGQVFNTNRYILETLLKPLYLTIHRFLQISDEEDITRRALVDLATDCDLIISSGGVSMGRFDYIKKVFLETDFRPFIQGTAIKPGRPLMVAEREGKLFFGLPGYPTAFLTNGLLYLVPAIKKACGRTDCDHRWVKATLTTPMRARPGRQSFNRAILELTADGWTAADPGSQTTSHFLNFAAVNGLVMMPVETGSLKAGTIVQALPFDLSF
jgi:molybdopterin molybdotransferase